MATSSAEPEKLYRYSDVALSLDSEVKTESARLRGSLAQFESACREPGFRLSVVHHAGSMSSYGSQCETIDIWVRRVGVGFQAADSGGFELDRQTLLMGPVNDLRLPHGAGQKEQDSVQLISTPPWLASALTTVKDAASWTLDLAQAAALTLVAWSMRVGSRYPSQITIRLPDFWKSIPIGAKPIQQIKELAQSSRNLTSFKAPVLNPVLNIHTFGDNSKAMFKTLNSHFNKSTPLAKIGLALAFLELAAWAQEDFHDYEGTELTSALAVDALLVFGPKLLAPAVGAVVGTLVCPGAGTVVGFKVGLVVTAVFPIAVRFVIDTFDVREKMTDLVDDKIMQPAANFISHPVESIDEAMRSTTDSIVTSMNNFSDWVWSSSRAVAEEVGL